MDSSIKKYLLIMFLFISHTNIINGGLGDFFAQFLEALYEASQPQQSHPSIEDHLASLKYNLKGLPQPVIDKIVNKTKTALQTTDLRNPQLINEKMNGALVAH